MKTHILPDSVRYRTMSARELRSSFLFDTLCAPGELRLAYLDIDRTVIGMAAPTGAPLPLPCPPPLRADHFLDRRELGALNIGGPGIIRAGSESFQLRNLDCLYLGRGLDPVEFASADITNPAIFYLLSYPAHSAYPLALIRREDATPVELGSTENANRRLITKYIHLQGARSCQLVMGVTHLQQGSVWNTMPPHTHMRRSEIYMYFNLPENDRVLHLMGAPDDTRHLLVANREIVASPGWSIHAGAGTHAYSFCWGMGGENQDYADMDALSIGDLL
ncbi:MAG TPA: 5-dehydro-4-deoxy-D-glucuronate isomerase [Terracidiphilus sp.]|nr:5-dehydro-4-deoxy-D-glucuronate isomerase [Terracidiphilus sp.]